MMGETENLVLELLRGMRPDIAERKRDVSAIRERLGGIDALLESWRYAFAAITASLVTGMKDHEVRIAQREGTPA